MTGGVTAGAVVCAALAVSVLSGSPGCPPGEHVGDNALCVPDNPPPPCHPGKHLSGIFCVPDQDG